MELEEPMNRAKLVTLLHEAEKIENIHLLQYKGLDLWPAIKIAIFFNVFNRTLTKDKHNIAPKSQNSTDSAVSQVHNMRQIPLSKVDIYFSEAHSHFDYNKDLYLSKYSYPILEQFRQHNSTSIRSVQGIYGKHNNKIPHGYDRVDIITPKVQKILRKNILWSRILPVKIDVKILKELFNYLYSAGISPMDNWNGFQRWVTNMAINIYSYKKFYIKYLKNLNPSVIVELCYYAVPNYGLNAAAKDLGIPTYEIMHGGMGEDHVAYSGWDMNKKKGGYNILPKNFWVWDEGSQDLVEKWTQHQDYHHCLLGGNPWLQYIVNHNESKKLLHPDKKIILYTMQFDNIEPWLVDAIENTSDQYLWMIRLHPRKIYAMDAIKQAVENKGLIHKVDFDQANKLPLPELLLNTSIHLSEYSGSIIEAAQLGVPSIILNEIGIQMNQKLIEKGICVGYVEKNPKKLADLISQMSQKKYAIPTLNIDYADILKIV